MIVVGQASAAATTIAIPAHQIGDIIIMFTRRASNTPAGIPGSGPTVPVWTTILSAGANTLALTAAYTVATQTNHTSGTWGTASHICCIVLRADAGKTLAMGASANLNGSNNQIIGYPALTLAALDGTSHGLRVGTRGIAVAAVGTPPTSWTNQIIQPAGASALMSVHTRDALVANPVQDNVTTSGTNSPNRAYTIELRETTSVAHDLTTGDSVTTSDSLDFAQDIVLDLADAVTLTDDPTLGLDTSFSAADSVTTSDFPTLSLFDPTAIAGCTHWFDAADDSAFLLDLGVAEWHDKAGSDQFFGQYSPSSQPLRTTGENGRNGLPVIAFDGSKYMTRTGDPGFTVGACTIFVVCGETSHPQDYAGILGAMTSVGNDHDQTNAFDINVGYTAMPGGPRTPLLDRASSSAFISSAAMPMSFAVYAFQCGASSVFPTKNGVGGTPGGAAANGTPYGLYIGTRWLATLPNMTYGLNGVIAEIAIYNRYLGDVDRERVEAYLTKKWLTPGAAHTITAADSVTTSDTSPVFLHDLGLSPADSVVLSDSPSFTHDAYADLAADSVTLSDAPALGLVFTLDAADAVSLSDSVELTDFTPLTIPGCKLWYDASQIPLDPGSGIVSWPNLAPAGVALVKTGAAGDPYLRSAEGGINGRPVVRFAAGQGGLKQAAATGVDQDHTFVGVMRMWGATKMRLLGGETPTVNHLVGFHSNVEDVCHMGTWLDGAGSPVGAGPAATTNPKLYSTDGASGKYAATVLADTPLLYYKLNETTGLTAFDASGNNHHGSYVGNGLLNVAGPITGDPGGLATNGVDDQIGIPASLSIPSGSSITIEWWQYMATADVAQNVTFRLGVDEDPANRILAHAPWVDNNLFWDYGSISANGRLVGSYTPAFNKWTLIHLTYDAATGKRAISFDGVEVYSAVAAGYPGIVRAGGVISGLGHKALIDEFAIYPTALSPARRLAHYNARSNYVPRFFSNGALFGTGDKPGVSGWANTFTINQYAAQTSDSEVAEVVAYDRKLSDAERQQVEDYLRTKWLTPGAALTLDASDLVTTTDAPDFAQAQVLSLADMFFAYDNEGTWYHAQVLALADSVTVTDAPPILGTVYELDVADAVTVSDTSDLVAWENFFNAAETVTLSESLDEFRVEEYIEPCAPDAIVGEILAGEAIAGSWYACATKGGLVLGGITPALTVYSNSPLPAGLALGGWPVLFIGQPATQPAAGLYLGAFAPTARINKGVAADQAGLALGSYAPLTAKADPPTAAAGLGFGAELPGFVGIQPPAPAAGLALGAILPGFKFSHRIVVQPAALLLGGSVPFFVGIIQIVPVVCVEVDLVGVPDYGEVLTAAADTPVALTNGVASAVDLDEVVCVPVALDPVEVS